MLSLFFILGKYLHKECVTQPNFTLRDNDPSTVGLGSMFASRQNFHQTSACGDDTSFLVFVVERIRPTCV